jgi:aspartyl/asparaginyl-tRNA synthetase
MHGSDRERISLATLSARSIGNHVLFRARVHTSRAQGNKMVFLNLRQRMYSVQGLVFVSQDSVSKQMVKWAAGIPAESVVLVEGTVQSPQEEVKSATVGDAEILIGKVSSLPLIFFSFANFIVSYT